MDSNAISTESLKIFFGINASTFQQQYKHKLSNFNTWDQKDHAEDYLIFPNNMGAFLSIDETALSNGELYTFLTNKAACGKKGTIVGIFKGVKSSMIKEHIDKKLREQVDEITLDLSSTMNVIAKKCFKNADRVADRFHVQRLPMMLFNKKELNIDGRLLIKIIKP